MNSARFSTGDYPAVERFERWRQITDIFQIDTLDGGSPLDCHGEVTASGFGDLTLCEYVLGGSGQKGTRSRNQIQRDEVDHYVVELYEHGTGYGETAEGAYAVRPGEIGIVDLACPVTVWSGKACSIALTIPRPLLDALISPDERLHGRVLKNGVSAILADHLHSLRLHLPEMTAAQAATLAQGSLALVASAIAPTSDNHKHARPARMIWQLEQAERYIERNLAAPALSAVEVAAAIHVSRSRLYRLFEPYGGVARYIQTLRLQRIRAALINRYEPRRVSELAFDHGFNCAAHCSRAFRRLFGYSPSEAREAALAAGAVDSQSTVEAQRLRDWLHRIEQLN